MNLCPLCDTMVSDVEGAWQHMKVCHLVRMFELDREDYRNFRCTVCHEIIDPRGDVRHYVENHPDVQGTLALLAIK